MKVFALTIPLLVSIFFTPVLGAALDSRGDSSGDHVHCKKVGSVYGGDKQCRIVGPNDFLPIPSYWAKEAALINDNRTYDNYDKIICAPESSKKNMLLDNLRVTGASTGNVRFELPIEKHHTNRLGILHGGVLASMVDLGGSLALASRGLFHTGVSTDLNVTYLSSGGKVGDLVRAEAICDKLGKSLAFTSIRFVNKDDELVARGSHTKYVVHATKNADNQNATDDEFKVPGGGPKIVLPAVPQD
ncbi:MAG: hypothetical protein Q9160_006551 [Pyrenula sp. 1 TL-2023]